jgi:TPR repeat protein
LYNFGRCLEDGIGISRDLHRAAKYYRLSADLQDPMAENAGLAAHGDPDGANNLGFCLEHDRGVERSIASAAECYKFAADRGHPEATINYRHCLRFLERWEVPDRSFRISDHSQFDDRLANLCIGCLKDCHASLELIASIQLLKTTMPNGPEIGSA